MPAVSVIVPNYNHAEFLPARLDSVLSQSFNDFELIILDDASSDNSRDIIEKFSNVDSRISFYPSKKNSGSPFVQWNKGVTLAKTNLIWLAESDDVASPDFLSEMVEKHKCQPTIALAFCQSNRMNSEGAVTGSWKTFTDDIDNELFRSDFVMRGIDFIDDFLIHKNVIPNASAVLFKKSVYEEVHGANENLRSNSDWLTWLKMLLNYDVAFSCKHLNYFRFHSQSVIARLHVEQSGNYKEQYDLLMRNEFNKYCANYSVILPKSVIQKNTKYQSFDYGNKGLYQMNRGQVFEGVKNVLRASLFPKPTLGYLKRLLKEKKQN